MSDRPPVCAVALPLPIAAPYRYAVPPELADRVVPGARVVVPVRSRELVGVVTRVDAPDAASDGPPLKPVLLAPDPAPLVPPSLLDLAAWMSRHYAAPLGIALRTMLPGGLWGASQLVVRAINERLAPGGSSRPVFDAIPAEGTVTAAALARRLKRPVWDALQRLERSGAVALTTEPPDLGPAAGSDRVIVLVPRLGSLLERDAAFARAPKQRALYEALEASGGEATAEHLKTQLGFSPAVVQAFVKRGLARVEEREQLRDPFRGVATPPPAHPTAAQAAAIAAVGALGPGGVAALYGVTGSGKTLVYLEALRRDVAEGRGAIVLVPEIGLTPQTVARVRGVFGDLVAVLHSGLSDAERADAWRAIAQGQRRVVVGARSAVFAPVAQLAAIVVDEEHDASYKNGEQPRYHARDVALARGRAEGARVVLGSATPSLETWAARERLTLITLPDRVGARALPPVRLVDLRVAPRVSESRAVPWSVELDEAVRARLDAREQVIILLNRRGFAPVLQCPSCGQVRECPHCSIALTLHHAPEGLRCHYCDHQEPAAPACAQCGHAVHRTRGVGTQAVEQWLSQRFPAARLQRMDADTTSTKWSHGRILDAFARGDVDILVGTQMVAKGLDFPGVTLVGVVDADTGLHMPDFRGAERTFQLIAQVAGRAGRGPKGGAVLVQTRSPDHPALIAAAAHDFPSFATGELAVRRDPPYPPHAELVNVVVSATSEAGAANAAVALGEWLRAFTASRAPAVEVLGPAPAPISRLKGRWRWRLLLRATDRSLLGRVLRYAVRRAPQGGAARDQIRTIFDRDPIQLM
ncbi:MAG TPA: primosomal protein N' [Gemmatimonadales bacterium]